MKKSVILSRLCVWLERAALGIVLTVSLLLAVEVFATYGFEDDFLQLVEAVWNPVPWWQSTMAQEGRPLYGLYAALVWPWIGVVENIWILRLFGLCGVVGLAAAHFSLIRGMAAERPDGRLLAWGVALLVALNPATLVYVFWACCSLYPWGGVSLFMRA